MNVDHDFVRISKLIEDQKKGLYQKWNPFSPQIQVKTNKKKIFTKRETLFSSPNSGEDQQKKDLHQKWTTFFSSPNSGEDQKKKSLPDMDHFFSLNSSGHLRSDAHQS